MATNQEPSSPRVNVRRLPARGHYDPAVIGAILDEALLVHMGFEAHGQVYVIPTLHVRVGDQLILHGSPASRMLKTLKEGVPCCATATLVDGIVLARSAFNHSMNYRSVVVLGVAREVVDRDEKYTALHALVEKTVVGRSDGCRMPSEEELRRTTVLTMSMTEASAKIRSGPPGDDEPDYALSHWAGVLPIRTEIGAPEPDPRLDPSIEIPAHVRRKTHRG